MDNPYSKLESFDFETVLNDSISHNHDIDKEYRRKEGKRHDNIRASSLGQCLRRQFLDDGEMGDGSIEQWLRNVFYHGNLIHDQVAFPLLQKWLKEVKGTNNHIVLNEFPYAVPIWNERVKHEMMMRGFVDDMIMIYVNGETFYLPIEIKSIGNAFFKLEEPEMPHFVQLMLYLHIFNADFGYIVYIHKGTLQSKTFKVDKNDEAIKMMLERGKYLYEFKVTGTIPHAEAMIEKGKGEYWFSKAYLKEDGEYSKDQCDGCPFVAYCLSIGMEAVPPEEEEDEDDW
jgi:hypothetical protein